LISTPTGLGEPPFHAPPLIFSLSPLLQTATNISRHPFKARSCHPNTTEASTILLTREFRAARMPPNVPIRATRSRFSFFSDE